MKGRESPSPIDFKKEENIVITYIKSQEAKLFELATEKLGASERLDVEQYLNRLNELYAISPRFVRLPVYEDGHEDEEIFEIDANARTIKVPASFAKNGVGVVSDELAETLWFRINRYFDLKDFGKAFRASDTLDQYTQPHILIEWEAPDGEKGASWAYAVDIETDDDYVYFGWALTSEHLTAKAGQIKFAIRILQYNPDGIAYSFATQVASVTIKPTLAFDLTAEDFLLESVADKISNRIMGGQIAFCPVFVDTPAEEEGGEPISGDLNDYLANIESGETTRLTVNAAAPDGETYDAMAYIWYKKGKDETEFSEVTEGDGVYTPSLAVTSSGQYYVVVYGMKEIVDNTVYTYDSETGKSEQKEPFWYHTSVASTKSTVCEIPMPTPLVIESFPAEYAIMASGQDEQIQFILTGRQTIKDAIKVGVPSLLVEKSENAAFVDDPKTLSYAEFRLADDQVIFEEEHNALIFKTSITTTTETPSGEEGGEPTITTTTTNIPEGYYRFTVLNTLNGDTAKTEPAFIIRITEPAKSAASDLQLVAVNADGTAYNGTSNPSVVNRNELRITYTRFTPEQSDGVEYEWFKRVGEQVNPEDMEGEATDLLIEGATTEAYAPTASGAYYARIINTFNNTVSKTLTNVVVFTD